ncbi:HD-GYP domain-containing protein [Cohnella herbarum]|uniref:HD-GYP domain-containing protein n=1 Tax=Cohnella herbarum TaxID=2728023 RepID=A0A7Z2VEP2_9BACL|nr:HD-GYP domain-containing protein [Cohnella herbarum]QJD81808.1 HD-GYP domain-containing protein [Cohnella herbarum]
MSDQPKAIFLPSGRILSRDLFNTHGVMILPAAHRLNEDDLNKLKDHGIDLEETDIEPLSVESKALLALEESVTTVQNIFQDIRQTGQIPVLDIRNEIMPAIVQSSEQVQVFPLLISMQAKDDYTYRHNIAVGAIASMLGRWVGLPENELAILTIGAILHDVGKMRIPELILNKKDKLSDEEFDIMKKHTVFGYEMIKSCVGLSHRSALIALQHHEREDGTGYPLGLRGNRIDYLSKIVAISDVFHALTSNRVYRNASPFYEILRQMYTGSLGNFDRHILQIFTKRLMNALVGCEVELTDGRTGKVVLINPVDPTRPLIQTNDDFIDLSKEIHLHMEQIIG